MKSSPSTAIACLSLILPLSNVNLITVANTAAAQSTITQKYQIDYKAQALSIVPQILEAANQLEDDNYSKYKFLRKVIIIYIATGEYNKIDGVINRISSQEIKSRLWHNVIVEYGISGELQRALAIAKNLPNIDAKDYAFKTIAEQYLSNNDYNQAVKIAENIQNKSTKAYLLINIATNYAVSGNKKAALDVLAQTFYLVQRGESEDSLSNEELLAQILFQYQEIGISDSRFQALANPSDIVLYNLFSIYANDQKYNQALAIINRIKDQDYKTSTLRSIADSFAYADEYEQALNIVNQIDGLSEKISLLLKIGEVAWIQDKKDQISVVLSQIQPIIQNLTIDVNNISIFTRIANLYSKVGDQEKALEIIAKSESLIGKYDNPYNRIQHILDLARQYREIGDKNKSILLLSQAETLVNTSKLNDDELYSKAYLLSSIASEYATNEEYEKAIQLVNTLENSEDRYPALLAIVLGYATNDGYNQALEFIDNLNLNFKEDKEYLLEYTRFAYIYNYVEAGELDKAVEAANQIKEPENKIKALILILNEYVEKEQDNRAIEIVNAIREPEIRLDALNYIASKYIYEKQYDKALNVINYIPISTNKISLLLDMAKAYNEAEKYDDAIALLDTIQISDNLANTPQLVETLTKLSIAYADANEKTKSGEILTQALAKATTIANTQDRALLLMPIAQQFINLTK